MGRSSTFGWRGVVIALVLATAAAGVWLVSISRAAGCDETWASTSTSGSYSTAGNWSPAVVPSSSTNVCLPAGSYTVTVTGSQNAETITVGAGVTLAVTISSSNGAALTLGSTPSTASSNSGTIELTDSDSTGTGTPAAELQIDGTGTLTNDGTILSDPGPSGLGTRVINGQSATSTLDNASDGTITVNQDLQIDNGQSGLFETSGAVTIASGKKLLADPNGALLGGSGETGEMDIDAGTITDNGTFEQGFTETGIGGAAALKVNGGTITGAGLISVSGASSDLANSGVGASFNNAGTGTYTFVGSLSANATTLGGTIGSNQTVVLSANKTDGNPLVHVASPLTNDGTIDLTDSDASSGGNVEDQIFIDTGQTLTNDGTIVSDPGPGGQGARVITGQSSNSGTLLNGSTGTITVNFPLQIDQGQDGVFTTQGAITIASGQTLYYAPNGGAVGGSPPVDTPTLNIEGGTITDNGNFDISIGTNDSANAGPAVNVTGGAVSGNPIFASQPEINFSGAGSGAFTLVAASSIFAGSVLSGTIGSGDQVILDAQAFGTWGGGAVLNLNSNVTNEGTLTVTDSNSTGSSSAADLEVGSGDTLTNHATISFTAGPGSIGTRSVSGTVSNASDGTIDANFPVALGPAQPFLLTNAGNVNVGAGATLNLSGAYTQNAGTTNLGGTGATLNAGGTLLNGGQLTGSGTVVGDLTNGAMVSPSPSPSTISVTGNYSQSSTGTLTAEVTATGGDKLAATGTAALDGTLQVSTAGGFTPPSGSQYQVLTGSSVSGTFATTTGLSSGPYSVTYNATNVTLTSVVNSPGVSFNPTSVAFGSATNPVTAGSTVSQTLKITDDGQASLTIGNLSLTGAQASAFSISSDTCAGATVAPGGSCTASINFHPASAGSYSAAVSVPDNAAGSPQLVPLTGRAGAAGPPPTTGTLAGTVANGAVSGNPPLTGASVEACQFGLHGSCSSATTAADGSYSISGLAPGAWQIQVEPTQSYLFAAGSVLTIVAGLNTHDYTLMPPVGLSNGITLNGETGGVGYSFWTSPATVQAPFELPTSGPAGELGITTIQFWVQPLTDTAGAPYAVGTVAIVYQFNSSGVPKFVGMNTQPFATASGSGPSIGTWQTAVTTKGSSSVPVAGDSVANLVAQGGFVPPPGGPDYHGAVLYEVHQWSLFTSAPTSSGADRTPTANAAQNNGGQGGGDTVFAADKCLLGVNSTGTPTDTGSPAPGCNPPPTPPPSPGACGTSNGPPFIWYNQPGSTGGQFDLGNGDVWNAGPESLNLGNNAMISNAGGTVTLWPGGNDPPTNLGPGLTSFTTPSGVTITVFVNNDGSFTMGTLDNGQFVPGDYTFHPDGSVTYNPTGATYNKHGAQTGGPPPSDNCKPKYNYYDPFNGWEDPSGIVMSTNHIPVPAATVVLTRSNSHAGPFTQVPNGSLFMAPNNRRNPDDTTALGLFGWDVVPGFYRVSAKHAGCKAAGGGTSVFSPVLTIPPAVTGINLKLKCPRLKRRTSHTKLTAKKVPVGEIGLIAIVKGRHPQGTVTFKHGGRTLGSVTLTHNGRAVFTAKGTSTKGFRAVYSGDGYNAPSGAGG